MPGLAILCVLIVLYGAVALRLERWSISMPLVFVAVGFLLGPGGTGILHVSPRTEAVKELAEITLGLLLNLFRSFCLAATARRSHDLLRWPRRGFWPLCSCPYLPRVVE